MSGLTQNIIVGVVLAGAAAVLVRQARGYWRGDRRCCDRGCGDKPVEAQKPKGKMFLPLEDLEKRVKEKEKKK